MIGSFAVVTSWVGACEHGSAEEPIVEIRATSTSGAAAPTAPGDATIANDNTFPTRIAQGGPEDLIAVSDASLGSVFLYDTDLTLVGEIEDLDVPLGVAVSDEGHIFVGSDGPNRIEAFTPSGEKLLAVSGDETQSASDLAFDRHGMLYVADTLAGTVRVFSPQGVWLRDIGGAGDWEACLEFPVALVLHEPVEGAGELLYVADRELARIQVFDLEGRFVESYGGTDDSTPAGRPGRFVKPQGLAIDGEGRLHVLDCRLGLVHVLDLPGGSYLDHYGRPGEQPGELELPLDILIDRDDRVIIANAGNQRLEVYPGFGGRR
jgi:DNA-binding beta-propeller fold protein YncE